MNFWSASSTLCGNGTKLFEAFDFETYNSKKEQYGQLEQTEKMKYRGADHYASMQFGQEPNSLNLNYRKLVDELNERLSKGQHFETLIIDTVFQNDLILNLLISSENTDYVKEIYKAKKLQVKGGINTKEATIIMECFKQGRSLLQAGQKADLLAKPLIDFYAACAYAYAIIVINSPLHKSIDSLKGSHGHTYNHLKETIDFGGNIPSGTFLDLLAAIPTEQIIHSNIRINYSLLDSIDFVQQHSVEISLGALLSMIPELRDSYKRVDSEHRLTHKLNVDAEVVNGQVKYNFYIGDGVDRPSKKSIENSFKTNRIVENQGSYKVTVDNNDLKSIMPTVYQDVKGQLWYIETPIDGLVIPELCLHFLTISALCNIMRYSPHIWSNIISNKISSQYSLLISEYIHLFELKFPMLVTQYITNYIPILV